MMDGKRERLEPVIVLAAACLWIVLNLLLAPSAGAGETLTRVRENGEVRCGVTEQLLGFSFREGN